MISRKKQSVTVADVAKLAGVSSMTVSRVLNNSPKVSKAALESVQTAMHALNYRKNIAARNLRVSSGMYIGLLYSNPSSSYLSEFILGALSGCRDLGQFLFLDEPEMLDGAVDLLALEKRIRQSSTQAVVVTPPLSSEAALIEMLDEMQIPHICVNPRKNYEPALSISIDEYQAAREMMKYLHDLGHRDIGIITGNSNSRENDPRLDGVYQANAERNIVLASNLIQTGDYTFASGLLATNKLLDGLVRPTAIFAFNDDMAAGAISAVHQSGLNIPRDISIVGFDDVPKASLLSPGLTTVRQPIREMAKQTVQLLTASVAGELTERESFRFDYELVIRSSAARNDLAGEG